MGVEDVLELQLQQLTLAQFTAVTMEHAIPLLRTGRSHCSRSKEEREKNMFYHLFFWVFFVVQMRCKYMPAVIVFYLSIQSFKRNLPLLYFCSAPLLITCLLRGSTRVPPRSGAAARRRPSARGLR